MLSRYEIMRLAASGISLPTDVEAKKYSESRDERYRDSELWEKADLCATIVKMFKADTTLDEIIVKEAALLMHLPFDQLKMFYDRKREGSVTFGQYDDLLGAARTALKFKQL